MKTLFVGGHHDGERLNVMQDGHVEALLSLPPDDYTLRHIQGHHVFYAPSSWSDDDALFALLLGYHGPSVADSPGDLIELQRIEIVRLQSRLDIVAASKEKEP